MTGSCRDRPAALLTRHFFHSLLDFGVFTPEGADSFVRSLIGVFAAILAFGFVLVRTYHHEVPARSPRFPPRSRTRAR